MALIDDLKTRFPNLDTTAVETYLPLYENNYKCYYNAVYGSNECDDGYFSMLSDVFGNPLFFGWWLSGNCVVDIGVC